MSVERPLEPQFAPRFIETVKPEAEGQETARQAEALFEDAVEARASDIHLDAHRDSYRVRLRVDGTLHDVTSLERSSGERILRHIRTAAGMDLLHRYEAGDGHLRREVGGKRWEMRISSAPTPCGDKLAIRLLNRENLERRVGELGMSSRTQEILEHWLEDSVGMALVVGPTGCGKTTTLYALLHELKKRQRSIVTIEDPVEYEVDGITQIQVREEAGLTFANGLRAMLRLDPDYLMVGELRDEESTDAAIDAAGAGHLLLATLHSRDAVGAVTMLRNYAVADHKIAAALELVVAQRLVRRLCRECREPSEPGAAQREWLERHGIAAPGRCWAARGCRACDQTGYHGRLGTFELWRLDKEFEDLILNGADEMTLRRQYLAGGRPVLLQDGLDKVEAGETSLDELQDMRAGVDSYLLREDSD